MATKRKPIKPPAEHDIWAVPAYQQRLLPERAQTHRRVLFVRGGRVFYCYGGSTIRDCYVETFMRWAGDRLARRVKNRRTSL